jgi:hypothetical protein
MYSTTAPTRDFFVTSKGMKFPKDGHFITGHLRAALRENRYEAKESQCVLKLVRDRVGCRYWFYVYVGCHETQDQGSPRV